MENGEKWVCTSLGAGHTSPQKEIENLLEATRRSEMLVATPCMKASVLLYICAAGNPRSSMDVLGHVQPGTDNAAGTALPTLLASGAPEGVEKELVKSGFGANDVPISATAVPQSM